MFNRIFLIICLAFLSSQATPVLYSFEGSITYSNGVTNSPVSYDFVVDFDMPSIINGGEIDDITFFGYTWDYGSVELLSISNPFFSTEGFVYSTEQAFHYSDFLGISSSTQDCISLTGSNSLLGYRMIQLNKYTAPFFEIGESFDITELYQADASSITQQAYGYATLISKTDYNPPISNVPEPRTLILVASSILMLSGLGIRRKRLILGKC